MATFIATITFTEQGMTNIQDTAKRSAALKNSAKKIGVKITDIFWTMGVFDGLLIFEAPDDETAAALMLHINLLGNVQTETTRAFTAAEMDKVLAKIAK
jgi:uncharacterized protein with GYD domain